MKIPFFLLGTLFLAFALCGCSRNNNQPTSAQDVKASQGGPPTPEQIKAMAARRSQMGQTTSAAPSTVP